MADCVSKTWLKFAKQPPTAHQTKDIRSHLLPLPSHVISLPRCLVERHGQQQEVRQTKTTQTNAASWSRKLSSSVSAHLKGAISIFALGSRPPPPPPPYPPPVPAPTMVSPPPPAPGPPLLPAVPHNRNNPRKSEGGRTMENDPSQWLLHRSGEPHQSRDRGTVRKEKRATSYFVW